MIHSLKNIPNTENRDYFIYLLDYGWDEPISRALRDNFDKMADIAAVNRAVVIKGTVGSHFNNEALSWHHINNQDAEELLPALLITNKHPNYFRENDGMYKNNRGYILESNDEDMVLLLLPFKKICNTTEEVVTIIHKLFNDIQDKKSVIEFRVAKEMKKGVASAICNAVVLEPNIGGVGINVVELIRSLKG